MSARTGVFPPPFESASRHAHDALSFLQWLSSFDGRGNRHTGDRHHPRVNRIRAPQHLFKHPLWVPCSLRWTSTSLHPADGLTRGQHSSRARRGAHCREIPIRTTPYLATAFSTPLTFTATSMKLSEPGFSIPLTIAYSRPSCQRISCRTRIAKSPKEYPGQVFFYRTPQNSICHTSVWIFVRFLCVVHRNSRRVFREKWAARQVVSPESSLQSSIATPLFALAGPPTMVFWPSCSNPAPAVDRCFFLAARRVLPSVQQRGTPALAVVTFDTGVVAVGCHDNMKRMFQSTTLQQDVVPRCFIHPMRFG